MSWEATRRLFSLRRPETAQESGFVWRRAARRTSLAPTCRAKSVCVVSGKGGTGKSMIAASLSSLLARRGPTLLLDADLGVGNAHILQGVSPRHTVADVLAGKTELAKALHPCRPNLDLLAGGSGLAHLAHLEGADMDRLSMGLRSVENRYDFMVVDSAAGLSGQTLAFAAACDLILVVTTPAVTALTDAYAFMKVLWSRCPDGRVRLVLNRVQNRDQGIEAAERLCNVTQRFLGQAPECLAYLPEHTSAFEATQERRPLVEDETSNPLVEEMKQLERLVEEQWAASGSRSMAAQLAQHLFA
ncbi:MAG: AAA family ATPase [Planctomycetes bacterium]|nr:AAA family ATPase [Planctomycetota bacterium]MCB9909027.1 AAA family ATPase [Planctomycetota bacterium]MCB9911728.1 AAA family ATPase [Planctomycetota bacterium]